MSDLFYIFVLVVGIIFAIIFGIYGCNLIQIFQKNNLSKKFRREAAGIDESEFSNEFITTGMSNKVLNYMIKISYSINHVNDSPWFTKRFIKSDDLPNKIHDLSIKCSMPVVFGNYAYREVQLRFCFIGFSIGALFGVIISYTLMFILAFSGIFLGMYLPVWAMKQEKKLKLENLDKCLPEMLEVVSLGLRSGLTFDRSLKIYTTHFNNEFSKSCLTAQRKWEGGICSREESLRSISSAYESQLLSRIIENIIRSLRFGSSLVEGLEEAAVESRNLYKAKQEEIVSKAPVKMMIPTGTLILPAMLILVLGPILLELGNGF